MEGLDLTDENMDEQIDHTNSFQGFNPTHHHQMSTSYQMQNLSTINQDLLKDSYVLSDGKNLS